MLCCSENCAIRQKCGLYWRNPQPDNRKYENNVEPLDSHGWDCGPLKNYEMFEPISDKMIYEKIAYEVIYNYGIAIHPDLVKAVIEQFKLIEDL